MRRFGTLAILLAALSSLFFLSGSYSLQAEGNTPVTSRISVSHQTNQQADDFSETPRVAPSLSGQFVAFASPASNLVAGDTNGVSDIFVRDRLNNLTERVSVASNGAQADGESISPSISQDGRFIAFVSYATNLVPNDTNNAPDIFVHDRQTGQTRRVSVSSSGEQANGPSDSPAISADGAFVAFDSFASNLVPNDTLGERDVFRHRLSNGETIRVSVSSAGVQGNGPSGGASISSNGQFIAFASRASNLVANDGEHERGGYDRWKLERGRRQHFGRWSLHCFRVARQQSGRRRYQRRD
jgi:Tol biopolymer transport system component